MIRCTGLRVFLGGKLALDLPQLEIAAGEQLGVESVNGGGKSTLLRVLAGLIAPTAGTVEGCPPPGRAVLVHQQPHLFRGTALDNVRYALRLAKQPAAEAPEWLARFDAAHLAERRARDLSLGEQRRIALARAMAVRPELLLLDEPAAGLDDAGTSALRDWLADFRGTLVLAAPDLEGAPVTRVVRLEKAGEAATRV